MKKFFTLIAAALMAVSAMAEETVDFPLTAESWSSGWQSVVTLDNGIIKVTNNEGQYGAAGIWIGGSELSDWSDYEYLTVVMESHPAGWGQIVIKGGEGDENKDLMTEGIPQISEQKSIKIDISSINVPVKMVCIQSTPADTYSFSRVYLTKKEVGGPTNKGLKITCNNEKTADYAGQVFINVGNIEAGKQYKAQMKIKSTAKFTMGSQALDETQTDHKNAWNNSAVLNYTESGEITSDWKNFTITMPGVTNVECHTHCTNHTADFDNHTNGNTKCCTAAVHENFEYAATCLVLSIGLMPKGTELYIDDLEIYDENGTCVFKQDFENTVIGQYDATKPVHYLPYQNFGSYEIAKFDVPETATAINNVTEPKAVKVQKSLKNGQIVITRGAKAYNAVGQEL